MKSDQHLGFVGNVAVLIFTAGIGVGLIWLGRGLWLTAKRTRNGISAVSKIEKLERSGNYLTGQFYARINFIAGDSPVSACLSLAPSQWNRLREGQTLRILYAPADPRMVSLGGMGIRRLYQASACLLAAIGVFIVGLTLWMLAAGLAGWGDIDLAR